MFFFSISLNVNDAIRKTNAQMIQNSFHKKNDDLQQFILKGKEDCTTLSILKK